MGEGKHQQGAEKLNREEEFKIETRGLVGGGINGKLTKLIKGVLEIELTILQSDQLHLSSLGMAFQTWRFIERSLQRKTGMPIKTNTNGSKMINCKLVRQHDYH